MRALRAICTIALFASLTIGYAQDPVKLEGAKVVAADSNKNDLIALPPDQKVPSTQRAVVLVAETQGQEVEWIVLNANPQAPVSSLQLASSKTLIVFPNDNNDTIVVIAYTQVNGKLSKPARHLCEVVKPTPAPPPTPNPTPTPPPPPAKSKVKHVTFVIDQATQTPDSATVITDQGLRQFISSIGAQVHTVTVNSASVVSGGLSKGVQAAGGTPCVVLQDAAGNITASAMITSVAATKTFLEQNQGK